MEVDTEHSEYKSTTNPLTLSTPCFVYIKPADVNFEKIKVQELDCAAVADGYWSYKNDLPHFAPPFRPQPPPAGMLGHVKDKGTKVMGRDFVQSVTRGAPYYPGTFLWSIPWRYEIDGKDQGVFKTVDMKANLDRTTLRHEKAEASDYAPKN